LQLVSSFRRPTIARFLFFWLRYGCINCGRLFLARLQSVITFTTLKQLLTSPLWFVLRACQVSGNPFFGFLFRGFFMGDWWGFWYGLIFTTITIRGAACRHFTAISALEAS
jgi:hypothetical protein